MVPSGSPGTGPQTDSSYVVSAAPRPGSGMNERRPAGWQVDGSLVLMTFIWGATFVLVKRPLADSSTLLFLTIRFTAAALVLALIFRNDFRAGKLGVSVSAGMLAGLCLFGGYV